MAVRKVNVIDGKFNATVNLPKSKSITNRVLILNFLSNGEIDYPIDGDSDDIKSCKQALLDMIKHKTINCQDSGTVARFLLPLCVAKCGSYYVTGSKTLCSRPMGKLINALKELGGDFKFVKSLNQMPLYLTSNGLVNNYVHIDIDESSQFLSGLLMMAVLSKNGITIKTNMAIDKKPYVQMTLNLMKHFGAKYTIVDACTLHVGAGKYVAKPINIEADASSASYFFASAALHQSSVTVNNLYANSIQGDLKFLDLLKQMGCKITYNLDSITVCGMGELRGIPHPIDMGNFSDTFMTLAAMAPFLSTPTTIYNIGHTRFQESDRIEAMVNGFKTLGIDVNSTQDSITIFPGVPSAGTINSYHDHRIAMSFALIGQKIPGIFIENPECVNKTCPNFFELLNALAT